MARRKENEFFELFREIFMTVPAWTCLPVAVIAFILINGVAVSVAGSNPFTKGFAELAPVFALFAALLILFAGWNSAQMKAERQELFEKQTGIDSIRALNWSQFEKLIGEAYRRQGYSVEETGGRGADGGIDLKLYRGGQVTLVQCKQWKAYKVAVTTVRELYGVMMAEKAQKAILVTSGVFTAGATKWAIGKPIELIDVDVLLGLINPSKTDAPRSNEPQPVIDDDVACPVCAKKMVLRTAKRGANAGSQFWGCSNYPSCKGTKKLRGIPKNRV